MPASSGHKAYSGWPFRRQHHPYFYCAPSSLEAYSEAYFSSLFFFSLSESPFLFSFPLFVGAAAVLAAPGGAAAAVAAPGGSAADGVAAGFAGGGLPVCDLDDDDDSEDEGDLALALIDHGVPYDPLRGFDIDAAVLAVEVAAGAVDRDDDAEAAQAPSVEEHQASAALLTVLHDDSVAGRRRSTRAMTAQIAANAAAAAEVDSAAPPPTRASGGASGLKARAAAGSGKK